MQLNERELAAILTGLRLLQTELDREDLSAEMEDTFTNNDIFEPLTADEIDDLCEKLNQ